MRNEFFRRKVRMVDITSCQSRSPDMQLARNPDRRWIPVCVEDVEIQVGNAEADRASGALAGVPLLDWLIGYMDGCLGDSVHVDQTRAFGSVSFEPGFETDRKSTRLNSSHRT